MARRKHAAWGSELDHGVMIQFQSGVTDIYWHKYAKNVEVTKKKFYVKSRFDGPKPMVFGLWHVGAQFGFWALGIVCALLALKTCVYVD